ncbi:MAG: nuclear transport factor 2 family protein [Alphaproteobacteria bacterium]|nr:nuclear transport factor 2 family protein [Alphaproteobacteria bacterium]MCW5740986.1 nuclear transport factor 2 family protein [Alphaproteobacteria bacterium]
MMPSAEQRDAIFRAFGRAFFKQDMEAMYAVVTPDFTWTLLANGSLRTLDSREKVEAFFTERKSQVENVRFADVVYHHAPDASFMTFRMTGTDKATGRPFAAVGVERYTFRDGRLAVKDVYVRPADAGG